MLPVLPKALSVNNAAIYTGIGRSTLYRKMKAGELSYIKIGSRRLIARSSLDELLVEGAVQ